MSSAAIVPHHSNSQNEYHDAHLVMRKDEIVPYNQNNSLVEVNQTAAKAHTHPKRQSLKKSRKVQTITGTVGGVVLGGVALGPPGMILGGVAGAATMRKVGKMREKKAQRKFEQREVQRQASRGSIHAGSFA